jgi:hypothetical protein
MVEVKDRMSNVAWSATVCDHHCVKELPYVDGVRTSSTTINNGDGPKSTYNRRPAGGYQLRSDRTRTHILAIP